jgi:nicotinamidase-related amidase
LKALLIIDAQQVFAQGPHLAHDFARVVQAINTVITKARRANVPVLWVQHATTEGALVMGTPGWQLAQGLEVKPLDRRIHKVHSDAFAGTHLTATLQELGIGHLVVMGAQSDFCVDSSVRRAMALGYDVTLVEDGHTTLDNGVLSAAQITAHHNLTLSQVSSYPGKTHVQPANAIAFDDMGASPLTDNQA